MGNKTLYEHVPHEHVIHNANRLHEQEQIDAGFNQKLAVFLARSVSSMWTAYIFSVLALLGLFGLLGLLNPFIFLLTTWISQQFLQLVFLPILSVEQSVIERKQQIQAEETYQTSLHVLHNAEQTRLHQDAQDMKMIEMHDDIQALIQMHDDINTLHILVSQILTRLEQLPAPRTTKKTEVRK